MSLHVCGDCGVVYLPAEQCPHCGGGVYRFDWEEEDMPKATVEGGPSGHAEGVPAEPVPEEKPKPAAKPKPAVKPRVLDADEGADN